MPDYVSSMTKTVFVMRVPQSKDAATEVTITGTGLRYDAKTGAILSGNVTSIALSRYALSEDAAKLIETVKISGVNVAAVKLADMAGDKFWNIPKMVVEMFDKFGQIHDQIGYSFFSPDKGYTKATESGDDITGSAFDDLIEGLGGHDALFGGAGDDTLGGDGGHDFLSGGAGRDLVTDLFGHNELYGDAGNDALRSGAGSDLIYGGKGNDLIFSGTGTDRVWGGANNDVFAFAPKTGTDLIIGDFKAGDRLVNLWAGSAAEAYKDFHENARQDGRNVSYDLGEAELILRNVRLEDLTQASFADAGLFKDAGLLF